LSTGNLELCLSCDLFCHDRKTMGVEVEVFARSAARHYRVISRAVSAWMMEALRPLQRFDLPVI
jgi:hypothetical protein